MHVRENVKSLETGQWPHVQQTYRIIQWIFFILQIQKGGHFVKKAGKLDQGKSWYFPPGISFTLFNILLIFWCNIRVKEDVYQQHWSRQRNQSGSAQLMLLEEQHTLLREYWWASFERKRNKDTFQCKANTLNGWLYWSKVPMKLGPWNHKQELLLLNTMIATITVTTTTTTNTTTTTIAILGTETLQFTNFSRILINAN